MKGNISHFPTKIVYIWQYQFWNQLSLERDNAGYVFDEIDTRSHTASIEFKGKSMHENFVYIFYGIQTKTPIYHSLRKIMNFLHQNYEFAPIIIGHGLFKMV